MYAPTNMISWILLPKQEAVLALLSAAAGEVQGQFSLALQPVEDGAIYVQP